jgi:hypothetical protein
VADQVLPRYRRPPPLYRLARILRILSVVVLVVLILFVVTALYSAYETARGAPSTANSSSFTTGFAPNNTLAVTGQFTFSNSGFYPVSAFTLHLVVRNGTLAYVGASTAGPVTFAPGSSQVFPIAFYLPVAANTPAASLLTEDQTLSVAIWANATFGYLFPVSVALNESHAWGAPFADFSATVGTPFPMGSMVEVPVTVQFNNHASFADDGTFDLTILSSSGVTCGTGSFVVDVPAGQSYSQMNDIGLASGCSPSGGTLETVYANSAGGTIALPPEPIP